MNCFTVDPLMPSSKTMPTDWKPRGPNSPLSLLIICATRKQCGHLTSMNSTITTLPPKLESKISFPEGSRNFSSGALRGTGAVANRDETVSARRAATAVMLLAGISLTSFAGKQSGLIPLLRNALHFCFCRSSGVRRAEVASNDARKHPGYDGRVEDFHPDWIRKARGPEVRRPVQRILELLVLGRGITLRIMLQSNNQIRDCLRVSREVATQALLINDVGFIDQIAQKQLGPFLVLRELPDHGTVGGMRESGNTVRAEQRRLQPDLSCEFRVFLFRRAQEADCIRSTGGLARQHSPYVVCGTPGEQIGRSRILVQCFYKLQGIHGEGIFVDGDVAVLVENLSAEGVQDGVQSDVAFQCGGKCQTAGDAHLRADSLPTAA